MFSYFKKIKEEQKLRRSRKARLKFVYAFLASPSAKPEDFEMFVFKVCKFLNLED
jgi:hypothetical protein